MLRKVQRIFNHNFIYFSDEVAHRFDKKIILGWGTASDPEAHEFLIHEISHLILSNYKQATAKKDWGWNFDPDFSKEKIEKIISKELSVISMSWIILKGVKSSWAKSKDDFVEHNAQVLASTMSMYFGCPLAAYIKDNYKTSLNFEKMLAERINQKIKQEVYTFKEVLELYFNKLNHFEQIYLEVCDNES